MWWTVVEMGCSGGLLRWVLVEASTVGFYGIYLD